VSRVRHLISDGRPTERARASAKTCDGPTTRSIDLIERHGSTEFVGRDVSRYSLETTVVGVLAGESGESELFLDTTPFYAESGGQVGDTGTVVTETGRFEVLDTQNVAGGLFATEDASTGRCYLVRALSRPSTRPARTTRRNHTPPTCCTRTTERSR